MRRAVLRKGNAGDALPQAGDPARGNGEMRRAVLRKGNAGDALPQTGDPAGETGKCAGQCGEGSYALAPTKGALLLLKRGSAPGFAKWVMMSLRVTMPMN